jgi:hypothetical protein
VQLAERVELVDVRLSDSISDIFLKRRSAARTNPMFWSTSTSCVREAAVLLHFACFFRVEDCPARSPIKIPVTAQDQR